MRTVKFIGLPEGFVIPSIRIYLKSGDDTPDMYFYVSQENGQHHSCAALLCTKSGENLKMSRDDFLKTIKPFEPKATLWGDGRVCLRFLDEHLGTELDMVRLLSENPVAEFPLQGRDIYWNPATAIYRAERMRLFLTQDRTLEEIRARFDELLPPLPGSHIRKQAGHADATDIPPLDD